jgi:predicted nucleotidyltransferase component of viral defense system
MISSTSKIQEAYVLAELAGAHAVLSDSAHTRSLIFSPRQPARISIFHHFSHSYFTTHLQPLGAMFIQ